MKDQHTILVPLDGSHTALRSLGCAAWLAHRLGGPLHVLSVTPQVRPTAEALAQLGVPREYWSRISLHEGGTHPEDEILAAVEQLAVAFLVMTVSGAGAEEKPLAEREAPLFGHVTRAIIERCGIPVVLIPPSYVETLPWDNALVPMSGEPAADAALALAARLAPRLDLKVHVAHVAEPGSGRSELGAAARYADAPHHEYAHRLDELIARALPHCPSEQSERVVDLALLRGDIAAELLRLAKQKSVDVIVVGWHGRFMTGHAQVLKELAQNVTCALLLARPVVARGRASTLKVGQEIE